VDAMPQTALAELYRAYIACLNRQDWPNLHKFVADDARHNGRPFGLAGYRAMLERDFEAIPDFSSTSNF
jgi:predicted ester cyclase